jgi:hypothetical protein
MPTTAKPAPFLLKLDKQKVVSLTEDIFIPVTLTTHRHYKNNRLLM